MKSGHRLTLMLVAPSELEGSGDRLTYRGRALGRQRPIGKCREFRHRPRIRLGCVFGAHDSRSGLPIVLKASASDPRPRAWTVCCQRRMGSRFLPAEQRASVREQPLGRRRLGLCQGFPDPHTGAMMKATMNRSPRRFAAALLVLAALGLTACGSNSSGSGSSTNSSSQPAQTSTSSGGASSTNSSSSSSGIPQGANAGDADADNHGGPSDGDGNL